MNSEILSVYAGWLIDGSGDAVQSKLKLDMVNGTIQSMRKISDPVPDFAKLDVPVLDLSDCTLFTRANRLPCPPGHVAHCLCEFNNRFMAKCPDDDAVVIA